MTHYEPISDEQLNAFLDSQLGAEEHAQVLDAIQHDAELAARVCTLRQVKEMVLLAYRDLPQASRRERARTGVAGAAGTRVAAAVLLLATGLAGGWSLHHWYGAGAVETFQTVARLNPSAAYSGKVLLHVSTGDQGRIEAALNAVEELLGASQGSRQKLDLEVIVNSDGLGMLREGSPYTGRIRSIVARYGNVSFLACGVAKENARLREGGTVRLIPEAREVPAALELILSRLKLGWLYIRA